MAPSPPTLLNNANFDVEELVDPETIVPRILTFHPKLIAVKQGAAGQPAQALHSEARIYGIDPAFFRGGDTARVPVAGFAVRRGSLHRPDTDPYWVGFYVNVGFRDGSGGKIPLDFTGKVRLICTDALVREGGKVGVLVLDDTGYACGGLEC